MPHLPMKSPMKIISLSSCTAFISSFVWLMSGIFKRFKRFFKMPTRVKAFANQIRGPFRPQVLASSTNNTLPMENAKRQRLAGSAWVAFDADPCNALASAGSPASVALEHLHFQRLNRKSFDARCSQGAIQEQQNVRWTRS